MTKNKSPLTFVTESLPQFEVGEEYSEWLQMSGGVPPYSFAVTGGTVPPGINVTSQGTVDGVPSQPGDTTFYVKGTDSAGASATQAFEAHVLPQPDPNGPSNLPLAWNNETSALSMAVGVPYELNLQALATGGTPPYSFALTAGSFPNGLDLTPAGDLAGTPSVAGNANVVIALSDSAAGNANQSFTCMVQE
ncbi:MAG: putative Ig domain-containing protein [Pyrinomonadaceae bacterium]